MTLNKDCLQGTWEHEMNGKHIHLRWTLMRDWWNATGLDMFKHELTGVIGNSNFRVAMDRL